MTLSITTPKRGEERSSTRRPSIYRKESRRIGEADPPMRGNHPGSLSYFGLGFFDEHHRDAVDDRVEDPTARTAQMVGLYELDLGVAFRARQDFEQLFRDHARM